MRRKNLIATRKANKNELLFKDPKIINYLVGKVMNQTKGSADPQETYDLILDNIKNDENVVEIIDSKKQEVIVKRSDDIDDIGKWRIYYQWFFLPRQSSC